MMAETNPELRAAIDVAKQRVKVDTYFPIAMNKGLKGHAQGYWAGTAMGMMTGGLGGGLLSLALLAIPAASIPAAAAALIGWPLVLGIGGLGAVVGGTVIGGDLGRAAGTSAGVMAEKERRERADALEKEILASPEKQREAIAAYRKDPVVEKDTTAGEILATTRDKGKALNKLIDLPTMALTVALCAGVGALMFSGAFALAGGVAAVSAETGMLGIGLGMLGVNSYAMAAIIGTAIGATSGVTFGITYPSIFASLTKGAADILAQKAVRGQSQFTPIKTVTEMEQEATKNRAISQTPASYALAANNNEPITRVSHSQSTGRLEAPLQQGINV